MCNQKWRENCSAAAGKEGHHRGWRMVHPSWGWNDLSLLSSARPLSAAPVVRRDFCLLKPPPAPTFLIIVSSTSRDQLDARTLKSPPPPTRQCAHSYFCTVGCPHSAASIISWWRRFWLCGDVVAVAVRVVRVHSSWRSNVSVTSLCVYVCCLFFLHHFITCRHCRIWGDEKNR